MFSFSIWFQISLDDVVIEACVCNFLYLESYEISLFRLNIQKFCERSIKKKVSKNLTSKEKPEIR